MSAKLRTDRWKSVKFTAPEGGLTASTLYKHNSLIVQIVDTVEAGQVAVGIYSAEKILCPKVAATGVSFAVGDKVYYNPTTKKLTNVVTASNILCGRATEAASATDTEAEIDLHGDIAA